MDIFEITLWVYVYCIHVHDCIFSRVSKGKWFWWGDTFARKQPLYRSDSVQSTNAHHRVRFFFVVAVLNRVVSLFTFWKLRRVISLFLSFCQSSSSSSGLDVTAAALTASAKSSLLACKRSPERFKKIIIIKCIN